MLCLAGTRAVLLPLATRASRSTACGYIVCMTNQELARELVYLDAKIGVLTTMLASLLAALSVRTNDGENFSEFLAELVEKLPKGYTERIAVVHDGKRDALTDLSQKIDRFFDGKTKATMQVVVRP